MMREIWIAVLLCCTAAHAWVEFTNSYVFSHDDFTNGILNRTLPDADWLVYGTSTGTPDFDKNTTIIATVGNKVVGNTTLATLNLADNATDILNPLTVRGNANLVITLGQEPNATSIYFYIVKKNNSVPVFDAGHGTRTVSANASTLSVTQLTFISAAPYFTLYNFDIGAASSINVHPAGYDTVADGSKDVVDSVLSVTSKEFALRSFVTIFGPIATITLAKLGSGTFSNSVGQQNWITAPIKPGAAFSAVSPGFISIDNPKVYASTHTDYFHFDWTSDKEMQTTISVQAPALYVDLAVTTTTKSDGHTGHIYKSGDKDNVKSVMASRIQVDYNLTAARILSKTSTRFLVQIISGGSSLSISFLVIVVATLFAGRN